ncbi:MAG: substrate-binding domain-containing protein [Roseofilum sp. SBFL]|uniref:substrate-binding domain-containing protein n=1 Tax=unclassified Roseofilum TaxID=2620099 RepID=UPI001B024493|nr:MULTISPECIES: substrate-binding domain-containing protein [unclassified Roseofilum]MBP0015831.1 substrate-binding domain-containing protein [Roseofilum sp. SID3]MBP0025626.1 substrate-binding domain-containing protein [Roseofilum sp. SID2]MBP0037002.1 substrate-binding domain-containing protein [Roseofilum sp. SID1]MBP0042737.1 substrate-binding domain-containing protein [Roseofilum sp. SBFL]
MGQGRNNRPFGRRTLEQIEREGRGRAQSRLSFLRSGLFYRLYRFFPFWMIRLIPFIQQDMLDLLRREREEEEEAEAEAAPVETVAPPVVGSRRDWIYTEYRCIWGDPLECDQPRQSIEADGETKVCLRCGFPAILRPKAEIVGHRGRYRVTEFLGTRGMGRLYKGAQVVNNAPVVIKEYLLPKRYFNIQEAQNYKDNFENVAGAVLADGRAQDFRVLSFGDAIGDRHEERCYVVTEGLASLYPTLRVYVQQKGAMDQFELLHFLNQVLQSLESLHGQKYRLPSSKIQGGLPHGNLSLDTLLILPQEQQFFEFPQFLIYLSDLWLWEYRFFPPTMTVKRPALSQDLRDLGHISFTLLTGTWSLEEENSLNPKLPQNWPDVDPKIQQFIWRLLEIDTPFPSAEVARQSLPQLSRSLQFIESAEIEEEEDIKRKRRWWWLLWLLLLLGLGSGLGWWLLRRSNGMATAQNPRVCCVQDVAAVPQGRFQYTAVGNGIWNYVIKQPNLVALGRRLETELGQRIPKLELVYEPVQSLEEAISTVRGDRADFAIASAINEPDLEAKRIAYDGLVIFVPFSYEFRRNSLPRTLNGQLSLDRVRQLYTGEVTNWQELGGPDLPVKLYVPDNPELIRIFEEQVLQDPGAIAAFRQGLPKPTNPDALVTTPSESTISVLPIFELLRTILADFEEREIGGIGFGAIAQVFGQCSVYPLAISTENKTAVQPLIQNNTQPLNPGTDLCNDKGSYFPHVELFQTGEYPLAYPLTVVYARDNSRPPIGQKFAELLQTEEMQNLLAKTGLIPLNLRP